MKKLDKKIIAFAVFVIFAGVLIFYAGHGNGLQEKEDFKNIVLIGWDGAQRAHLKDLLNNKKLPNLESLINEGAIVDITVTTGATVTKPGWAEILTGYSPGKMGIYSNTKYRPIPEGYTIFERLEKYFGENNIATVFIGGKINNIGARGPHVICINCLRRDSLTRKKTGWWEEDTQALTRVPGEERKFVKREGEPYYYTKNNIDMYKTALGSASNVGPEVLSALEKLQDQRFFAFFHFEEPDEVGHIYGENSEEYTEGIITDDYWLGKIVDKLIELEIYDKTLIYVVSDHGFDEGEIEHREAPFVFLATNDSSVLRDGDRKDITPTLLDRYGFDLLSVNPPLDGVSLLD